MNLLRAFILKADSWLLRLDQLLIVVAATAVFVMMILTASDVVMRYAFNSPLAWAFDLITHYLLITAFAFGFSYTLRINHHISIDFFSRRLPDRFYHVAQGVSCLIASVIFAYICWLGAVQTYDAWAKNEVVFGAMIWPVWPQKIVIPIALGVLALRAFHRALSHLVSQADVDLQKALEINVQSHAIPEE